MRLDCGFPPQYLVVCLPCEDITSRCWLISKLRETVRFTCWLFLPLRVEESVFPNETETEKRDWYSTLTWSAGYALLSTLRVRTPQIQEMTYVT